MYSPYIYANKSNDKTLRNFSRFLDTTFVHFNDAKSSEANLIPYYSFLELLQSRLNFFRTKQSYFPAFRFRVP